MSATGEHTNRLARASSPYLLLHQHNPVDWYEWGDEALERARREDRPIFLSVGYSTCYWCHVMERESFSNERIAALMNESFVNIKLDREERPELDEIYMTATQVLTGRGGWPNSVFLTPGLEPFFAGTYFPPTDRPGLPGFPAVLRSMKEAWRDRRGDIETQAESVVSAVRQHLGGQITRETSAPGPPGPEPARRSLQELGRTFDPQWGGFGSAPKFPTPSNLFLLLEFGAAGQVGRRADDELNARAAEMLGETLDQMARGGIYDQLGGGFHRYATDREWKIPHFEKMLYDNGLLLEVYARHFGLTADPQSARVLRQTADFLSRELTSDEGAFWSALDAETGGAEGAFHVWTRQELRRTLGEEDFGFLAPLYGFDGKPFFEGEHYVLHLPERLDRQAKRRRTSESELTAELEPLRRRLFEARAERPHPLTDDKILVDWNGTVIAGLALAGSVLGDESMIDRAVAAADFILERLRSRGGRLLHAWRRGAGEIEAFLGDYVFLVRGLLALGRATGEEKWRDVAAEMTREQIERLADEEGGFYASESRADVLVRSKDLFDGAMPAANSIAVLNLLELAAGDEQGPWADLADRALRAAGPVVERVPAGARTMALAALRWSVAGSALPSADVSGANAVTGDPGLGRHDLEDEARGRVQISARAGAADDQGRRPLRVTIEIEPGWHVYAGYQNEETPGWLEPTGLVGENAELDSLAFPVGEELPAAPGREPVLIYEGRVEITGRVRDLGDSPHRVRVRYQACDETRCLAPVERVVIELDQNSR